MRPLILLTLSPDHDDDGAEIHAIRRSYVQAIEDNGGFPLLVPIGLTPADAPRLFSQIQGVLLPGGWDFASSLYGLAHPKLGHSEPLLDQLDIAILRWALAQRLPTLGICRGMQLINIILGGSLYMHLPDDLPAVMEHKVTTLLPKQTVHTVVAQPHTQFASIVGTKPINVNSRHHQAVKTAGKDVVIAGIAPDNVVEAIEVSTQPFMLGVEFHPEDTYLQENSSRQIFRAFINAARRYTAKN